MAEKIPNHICKSSKCGKEYWACDSCDKLHNWRALTCSPECFQDYMDEVEEARNPKPKKNKKKTETEIKSEEVKNTEFELLPEKDSE